MKPLVHRVEKLEAASARDNAGADAEVCAAATAELTEVLSVIAAEKAAGDVHGVAQRLLDGVLAAMERRA